MVSFKEEKAAENRDFLEIALKLPYKIFKYSKYKAFEWFFIGFDSRTLLFSYNPATTPRKALNKGFSGFSYALKY